MIDVGTWPVIAAAAATTLVAGARADRMLRDYLLQRLLVRSERQRSKRGARRTEKLVRLVGEQRVAVRIVERDEDGFRMIEVDDAASERKAA